MSARLGQNKYTRLLSNTVLFGISTFSSKVLSFLLTRLYTSYMTEDVFGLANLITVCASALIPLVSLGISNAVIRFGLEKDISKKGVYTSGLVAIGGGFAALLSISPLLIQIPKVSDYALLLYVYVLISCLRTLNCQFVRAKMQVRLYAIDGILATAYTIGFNILFLVVLRMGATGYLLSIICADACSTLFLFVVARLWPYIRFKRFDWSLLVTMLRYSLPLVPALMFWWITQMSDQFFITFMKGEAANGLYAAAYKLPAIVTIFATIFTEAWQLSAVTDGQSQGRDRFFTRVFSAMSSVAFAIGGALIILSPIIMHFLAPKYEGAWRYVPILVIATVFSSMVAFQNSVYMVEKRSNLALATIAVGAGANIALNALLIPPLGPNGAAVATALSYILVFVIRGFNTRRYIRLNYRPAKIAINTVLLVGEVAIMLLQLPLWPLWCGLLLAVLLVLNLASLYRAFMQLLHKRRGGSSADGSSSPTGGNRSVYRAGSGMFEQ